MQISIPKIPEPLLIWEKLEILTAQDTNAGLYLARIEDFVDNGLVVTQPELIKGDILLRDNCEVTLQITKSDAIYQFQSTIQKRNVNGRWQYFLSEPKFLKRIQRRNFSRLIYSTAVEYTPFNAIYKSNQEWSRSFSWDISGNGILIETKDFVKQNSFLLMKIQLFDELNIKVPVLGRVHRVILDNHTRLSGIEIIGSSEVMAFENNFPIKKVSNLTKNFNTQDQEKLISFIFNEQIKQRKKGML